MRPASRMATIISEVATGRRMNGRDGFKQVSRLYRDARQFSLGVLRGTVAGLGVAGLGVAGLALAALAPRAVTLACAWRRRRLRVAVDRLDLRAVLQLV